MINAEVTEQTRDSINALTSQVIRAAMRVHSALGPGLLENAYRVCLAHGLRRNGLRVQTEVFLPVQYEGIRVDLGYRIDLLVEDQVVVELKAAETVLPVHKAQLLSYLRLSNKRVGLLINFHADRLKNGINRIVNGF
jgi:GxxExxY protein